jgi:hypothetical protein
MSDAVVRPTITAKASDCVDTNSRESLEFRIHRCESVPNRHDHCDRIVHLGESTDLRSHGSADTSGQSTDSVASSSLDCIFGHIAKLKRVVCLHVQTARGILVAHLSAAPALSFQRRLQ